MPSGIPRFILRIYLFTRLNLLVSLAIWLYKRIFYQKRLPFPLSIYWVSPHSIEFVLFGPDVNQKLRLFGRSYSQIQGKLVSVKEDEKYKSLYQRFELGLDWINTDIFCGRYLERNKNKLPLRGGATSLNELAVQYKKYDDLYFYISNSGYKAPGFFKSLSQSSDSALSVFVLDNGKLAIGSDGNHRLIIACLTNQYKIPIRIQAWEGRSYLSSIGL